MKLILFGHRGVGKSSLLERLQNSFSFLNSDNIICLDALIEKESDESIKSIMEKKGEEFFRELEKNTFAKALKLLEAKEFAVLALGAGFLGTIPADWKVLWVQRAVDTKKFIFRDRPSLSSEGLPSLPLERFYQREKRYSQLSHFELELLEHKASFCESEKKYFAHLFSQKPLPQQKSLFVTVQSSDIKNFSFSQKRLGYLGWELRDDWLSTEEIEQVCEKFSGPLIISFRKQEMREKTQELLLRFPEQKNILWDWPLEWGECPFAEPPLMSLHERKTSLQETLSLVSDHQGLLKLAVPIKNFSELKQAYQWFLQQPEKRIFLPSSDHGRWQWFRQLTALSMPFSFLREGRGSSPDQPTFLQAFKWKEALKNWGAVLGQPVKHSLTPWFQEEVFSQALAVDMAVEEWDEALPFLQDLGMNRAAVTSPLKQKAFDRIENKKEWQSLGAINTLAFSNGKWWGSNTDALGFAAAVDENPASSVAVWGGGGVLSSVMKKFPQASHYSSRTGELKKGESHSPDIIVWAVGRESFDQQGLWPPEEWRPGRVIDLNYSEDSPGLMCAHRYGCQYQSGLGMFIAQAEAQQEFWKKYEC